MSLRRAALWLVFVLTSPFWVAAAVGAYIGLKLAGVQDPPGWAERLAAMQQGGRKDGSSPKISEASHV